MISLSKGQTISLAKGGPALTRVALGVGWDARKPKGFLGKLLGGKAGNIDLDASCLMFDAQRKQIDAIWFRQLKSRDGSIMHSGDNLTGDGDGDDETITVDLSKVPASITTLMFTVNSFQGDTFDKVDNAYVRLIDLSSGDEMARYNLSESGSHTGLVMCRLKRSASEWQMTAIGAKSKGATFHDMQADIRPNL